MLYLNTSPLGIHNISKHFISLSERNAEGFVYIKRWLYTKHDTEVLEQILLNAYFKNFTPFKKKDFSTSFYIKRLMLLYWFCRKTLSIAAVLMNVLWRSDVSKVDYQDSYKIRLSQKDGSYFHPVPGS